MPKYVRGSEHDKWHWCTNCTQYPTYYIYQETHVRPPSDFCEQCSTKEKLATCQCEEQANATDQRVKSEIALFSYNDQSAL